MDDLEARELATQYIKDQLESIGNDFLDVVEYLEEDGIGEPEEDGRLVAEHIGILTKQLTDSLNTGGK